MATRNNFFVFHIYDVTQWSKSLFFFIFRSSSRSSLPEVFYKNGVYRNFAKFTGKNLCQSLIFNKVAGIRPATLLKKRPWHRFYPVNFAKFLRTPYFTKYFRWLLLCSKPRKSYPKLTFTCSKSAIEILKKGVKICSKLTMKTPERCQLIYFYSS